MSASSTPRQQLLALLDNPTLRTVLVEHARRGIRVQLALRWALAAFVLVCVLLLAPAVDSTACRVIAVGYALWAVLVGVWARRAGTALIRWIWLALLVDLAFLTAAVLVASGSDAQSWTADVLVNGYFVIPVLAATQLRVRICAAVSIPTVVAYLVASALAQHANDDEPWASIGLRTGALAIVACGAILLSRVQASRVLTIGELVQERERLLAELLAIEDRERRTLAEELHDGALQYVLAAGQDLEDARTTGAAESFERIGFALSETSTLLRTTVARLHPAVLGQLGLLPAIRELANGFAARGRFAVTVEAIGWPEDARTDVDGLLYSTARELLSNVAKHAGASAVTVRLRAAAGRAELEVADDGRGIPDGLLDEKLREGHIGLESRRVRLAGAGGSLRLSSGPDGGAVVVAEVPLTATA